MMPFASLFAALDEIQDPRRPQGRRYTLAHLLLFSVLAVLAGATSYQSIITFMSVHREHLNAIFGARFRRAPAVNTLRNLFLALDPADLEAVFRRHARQLDKQAGRNGWRTVALDGKTLRGSFDHLHDQTAAHVLSAFASDAALILAHQEVEGAPEEVPAVPDLIAELGLSGVLFTADALHCQKGASAVRPRQAMPSWCASRQTSQACTMRWPRSVPNTSRSSGMRRWTAIAMAAKSIASPRFSTLTAASVRSGSRWSPVRPASLA
jgi:predicted transposase YbfD/YdcC